MTDNIMSSNVESENIKYSMPEHNPQFKTTLEEEIERMAAVERDLAITYKPTGPLGPTGPSGLPGPMGPLCSDQNLLLFGRDNSPCETDLKFRLVFIEKVNHNTVGIAIRNLIVVTDEWQVIVHPNYLEHRKKINFQKLNLTMQFILRLADEIASYGKTK